MLSIVMRTSMHTCTHVHQCVIFLACMCVRKCTFICACLHVFVCRDCKGGEEDEGREGRKKGDNDLLSQIHRRITVSVRVVKQCEVME